MKLNHLIIEKIEITQFKKIRDLVITPDEKGNLLYGTYRSGKTSLCEFIQFALYGAASVSLARGNAEDAKGKIFLNSDQGPFVIERKVIGGNESYLFYTHDPAFPVETTLTPGEYLTELDHDSFVQVNYFRQTKYEPPSVKPKFSLLNKIASFSPDTRNLYRDIFVQDKKRRLYRNEEKNGSLDLLLEKEAKLKQELEEHADWEREAKNCIAILDEIHEKIDENDRRCVLLKADMAGFEDDLRLSQNKENAEDLHKQILAKEKKLHIAAFEVTNKIGKLSEDELDEMKDDYNRLSLAITALNEAHTALADAEENLVYHEGLFTGINSLESLDTQKRKISKEKGTRLALCIFGILMIAGAACVALLLNHLNFNVLTCIASAVAIALCGTACLFISTLFSARIKAILEIYDAEDLAAFYEIYEKVEAHGKTTQVYRSEVESAREDCQKKTSKKNAIYARLAEKAVALGFSEGKGDLLAFCDEVIEANDALYDLQSELEEDKATYRRMLTENVERETLSVSPEFAALQKEHAFLSAQNDALYKKKALLSARLQEAKEKSAKSPDEIERELDALSEKLSREKAEYDSIDLNFTLATARMDKFEEDLKKLLTSKINRRLAFLLREGESFVFDEEFELCFCDQKSVLPLISAGGGVITEMGVLSFRLALSEVLGSTHFPMIFDDSLAVLSPEQSKTFYDGLRETCSQFFIITSSDDLCEICRETAKFVEL